MNPNNRLTARRIAMVEAAINDKALDCREIALAVHASRDYMIVFLRKLLALRMIHVESWRRVHQTDAAVYRWGAGKCAPKPRPKPVREIVRAYRARLKKDKERFEFYLARERAQDNARRHRERAAKAPQTWLSALMLVSAGKSVATGRPAEHKN